MDKMELWRAVEETDPRYTKNFTKGGGFSGTAIGALYLVQKATEKFGPVGIGWGVEVLDEQYVEGAPLYDSEGKQACRETVHKLHIRLWYVLNGKRGEVEQYGLTTVIGLNKKGFFTDEDHAKKSLTDAMTKALSWLGFSADVHMGWFDDSKYVNNLREKYAKAGQETGEGDDDLRGEENYRRIRDIADACIELHGKAVIKAERDADMSGYWEMYEKAKPLQGDDRLALWEMLKNHSSLRAALKEYGDLDRAMAKQKQAVPA